jgi:hypothetical protein
MEKKVTGALEKMINEEVPALAETPVAKPATKLELL